MFLTDNDRLQEWSLLIGDRLSVVSKKWWYALAATVILAIPGYYVIRASFVSVALQGYTPPKIIYATDPANREPLKILDKQIFGFPGNMYGGYVKIQNINLEWGVAKQEYKAEFKTLGGTVVNTVSAMTFILP